MIVALLLAACQTEQDLVAVDPTVGPGGAWQAEEDVGHRVRRERFEVGRDAVTPVSDYLFVIDGSASMGSVLRRFHEGFRSLAGGDAFPAKARIAVTSTLPGDPSDLTRPHPAVTPLPDVELDPGFLRLVDRDGIRTCVEQADDERVRARYPFEGCDAWFSPGETNADGIPCLLAHAQLSRAPVGAEAGLTALAQILEKTAGTPLFRPGASVNVVFVSDTHDPGFLHAFRRHPRRASSDPREDLASRQPSFEDLDRLVRAGHDVAAFRVHAIAPATECGERWDPEHPAYFTAAEASGGQVLDVCTATDYSAFIGDIAQTGARMTQPVVPLGRPAADVLEVRLDGAPVDWRLASEGAALELVGVEVPDRAGTLEVTYRW